jgi:hypothetical protein
LQILNKWLADYITKFHTSLWLEGPVTEPMYCPIINNEGKTEILGWNILCNENGFQDGDVVKFIFFDIENSNRVDVDKVNN